MAHAYNVHVRAETGVLPYARQQKAARYLVDDFRYDGPYLTLHGVREANGSPHLPPETFGISHDHVRSWVAEKVKPDGSPLMAPED